MSYVEMNQSKWFIDSGYSNHTSGNKGWFSDLDEGFKQIVKLSSNSRIAVIGRGTIRLQVNGYTGDF